MAPVDYIEDPFQLIVNVGWNTGAKFAVVLFNSIWQNGAHNTDNFDIAITPLAQGFPIYGNINFKNDLGQQVALSRAAYRNHTQSGEGSSSFSETFYHYIVSTTDSFGQGWVRVVETTSEAGTVSGWAQVSDPPTYAPNGLSGSGGIGAFGAFMLTQGWTAFGTDTTDGPHTSSGGGTMTVFDTDNACVIFQLDRLRALCPPGTTHAQFDMSVGAGPSSVHDPDHVGIIGYNWSAKLRTYTPAAFENFTTDSHNLPNPGWPAPVGSATLLSTPVQPTPAKHIRFVVDLADLSVVGSVVT